MSSVFEMREECMEGLYVLNPGPGQDEEVNEAFNIKKDPGVFMVLGHVPGSTSSFASLLVDSPLGPWPASARFVDRKQTITGCFALKSI